MVRAMNTQIEHPICILFDEEEVLKEFGMICIMLNSAETLGSVKSLIEGLGLKHFKWGFGSSHFWAKQIINGELSERVIFKQF